MQKTGGARRLGLVRNRQHVLDRIERLRLESDVVMDALWTVLAVLGATTGLDAQQRRQLDVVRIEVSPQLGLCPEDQIDEREIEQGFDLGKGPVVPQPRRHRVTRVGHAGDYATAAEQQPPRFRVS